MPIPESQLETWARQGAVAGSRDTYASIRASLERVRFPGTPNIFLQGSYGNDTNIYAESDVDVVIRTDEFFYYDLSGLSDDEKAAFHRTYPTRAAGSVGYDDFKTAVVATLREQFGATAVTIGRRAVSVAPSGGRRRVDVIVASELRRYDSFPGTPYKGISFFDAQGQRIDNFPEQHSANCTRKHQNTNGWFKPTVRIIKNARSYMVDRAIIPSNAVAPSYFIEGLLWNVPRAAFGGTYQTTVERAIQWIGQADVSTLSCANDLVWLVRDSKVTWARQDYDAFVSGLTRLWVGWR